MGRIPEEACIELLKKYQDEKTELVTEIAALEAKLSEMEKTTADVESLFAGLKRTLMHQNSPVRCVWSLLSS